MTSATLGFLVVAAGRSGSGGDDDDDDDVVIVRASGQCGKIGAGVMVDHYLLAVRGFFSFLCGNLEGKA